LLERGTDAGEQYEVPDAKAILLVGGLITHIVFITESAPQLFDWAYCLIEYVPGFVKFNTTVFVPLQLLKFGLEPPKLPDITVNPVFGVITYFILVVVEQVYPCVALPVIVFPFIPVLVNVTVAFGHTVVAETVKFASGLSFTVIAGELAQELSQAFVATT
jgi:hypothetical protein